MTIITDPSGPKVQAIFLRDHCRMFAAGMRHSRFNQKELKAKVSALTGKPGRNWPERIAQLEEIINDRG